MTGVNGVILVVSLFGSVVFLICFGYVIVGAAKRTKRFFRVRRRRIL